MHDPDATPEQCAEIEAQLAEMLADVTARAAHTSELRADMLKTGPLPDWWPQRDNDNCPGSTEKRPRFELTWFDDIAPELPKVEIIEGVLGEGEFSVVVGKPGSGKSVIVTDMACHVAAGRSWHGHEVSRGLVVYFAAERRSLTLRRMLAFRKHHDISGLPLVVVGGKLDMTSNILDAAALAGVIEQASAECGLPCVWVIIDTLSRVFGGGDQNASKDMGKFVQSVDEITRSLGCHTTVIHHSGWGTEERGKGAIDLDGAVDTSFFVRKAGEGFTLVCDGTNDGVAGPVAAFGLTSVAVATDKNGVVTTAPVVVPKELGNISGVIREPEPVKPTKQDEAFAHLLKAIEQEGLLPDNDLLSGGEMVVGEEAWRQRCYDAAGDVLTDTKSKSFRRAKDALLAAGRVCHGAEWYWPAA